MKTQMEDIRNNADITPNRNDIRNTADIRELYAIGLRASKIGDINGKI